MSTDTEINRTRPPARTSELRRLSSFGARGIFESISAAKTETTRAKRIDETAQLAQRNIRASQRPRQQA